LTKLVDINDHLLEILRKTTPNVVADYTKAELFSNLPLRDIADLDLFIEWLKTENNKSKLVKNVYDIGKRSLGK